MDNLKQLIKISMLIIVVILSSCNEDFLETEPLTEISEVA